MLAPIKINLCLEILGRRPDGYHELQSFIAFGDFGDRLQLSVERGPTASGSGSQSWRTSRSQSSMVYHGTHAKLLEGDEKPDLVQRATGSFCREFPELTAGYNFRWQLWKEIPIAAGLGGGSADAAAALRLLLEHFSMSLQDTNIGYRIEKLAAKLGADVPVCLYSAPRWVTGTGVELGVVQPSIYRDELFANALVVSLPLPLSTAQVFSNTQHIRAVPASMEFTVGQPQLLSTRNDLQRIAESIHPEIGDVVAALSNSNDCWLARMSGSGGAVFGLFTSAESRKTAAQSVRKSFAHYPSMQIISTSLTQKHIAYSKT